MDGIVSHLWHGRFSARGYTDRSLTIKKYNYDPEKDISIGRDGLYQWTQANPELAKYGEEFFIKRNEDEAAYGCQYREGFYNDELDNKRIFHWAEARAELKFTGELSSWRFKLRNKRLKEPNRTQEIKIFLNKQLIHQITLTKYRSRIFKLTNIQNGDILSFESDFDFFPADYIKGSTDRRLLSFMVYENPDFPTLSLFQDFLWAIFN